MSIDYQHAQNTHTLTGPEEAFPVVLRYIRKPVRSLVDVGCGTGPWLRAARLNAIDDLQGFDGALAPNAELAVSRDIIQVVDFTRPLPCARRFDVALCLEVAEHLEEKFAGRIVCTLANLANTVVFSAACPGQPGQHHVNCQWPAYWQSLFNSHGFVCNDAVRWAIWDMATVEPWYRQNMFVATRDAVAAGKEARMPSVLHPDMALMSVMLSEHRDQQIREIQGGSLPTWWYIATPLKAIAAKIRRHSIGFGSEQ